MPGVETGIRAAFAAPEKFSGPADERAGASSGEGDFDRAMQAALAPSRQRPEAKNSSTASKHSPAAGKTSPHTASAKATNPKDSQNLPSAEKSEKAANAGKDAPVAMGDTAPDANGFSNPLEVMEPSTASSLLSLFFGSPEATPPPGKLTATGKPAENGTVEAFGTLAAFSGQQAQAASVHSALVTSRGATLTDRGLLPAANPALPGATAENKPGAKAALFLDPPVNRPVESENFKSDAPAIADAGTNSSSDDISTPSVLPHAAGAETVPTNGKTISADEKAALADAQAVAPAEGKADFERHIAAGQAVEGAGTGVASTLIQMKNPLKANKVAGLEVKDLPVGEHNEAHEKILPAPLLVTPVRASDDRDSEPNLSFSSGNGQTPVMEKSPLLNVVDLPSLADARMRAMERAHDMVALHAMRLVESKSDALSVVIKPAVGMELSLELRQRDGVVEAQATLTRGDHEFLSQHWPELQQRLEQRGIKLGALGGEADLSANDHGNFQRQQASQEEAAQQASAFAEFATAGNFGGATARMAVAHDGWESWA